MGDTYELRFRISEAEVMELRFAARIRLVELEHRLNIGNIEDGDRDRIPVLRTALELLTAAHDSAVFGFVEPRDVEDEPEQCPFVGIVEARPAVPDSLRYERCDRFAGHDGPHTYHFGTSTISHVQEWPNEDEEVAR